jgi:hypothetical protein
MHNRLENVQEIIHKVQYLNLKVLWLNGNPLADDPALKDFVDHKTRIEVFNRKFTSQCTVWGIKYAHSRSINFADSTPNNEIYSLNLDSRNVFNVDLALLESFTSLRSLSIRRHPLPNQEEELKLLRIMHLPSLSSLFVDEETEVRIRAAYKRGDIKPEVAERLLVNKHSLKLDLSEGDAVID